MVKGTDIVKQWGTTLDGDTRPNRIQLDGQMRELDEDELAERKKHAEYFRLDKSAEFEKKYLKAAEKENTVNEPLPKNETAAMKTPETFKNSRKSGIISLEKDPIYDGLSKEDIASRYIKPDGSNLLDKDVLELPLDTQREMVRGYDKAIELF